MKPDKPTPDFPLYAHTSGRWAKKIQGKTYYFGSWDKPDLALKQYQDTLQKLENRPTNAFTLKDACNAFLAWKKQQEERGTITASTWKQLKSTCQTMCDYHGKNKPLAAVLPQHWERYHRHRAKRISPVSMGNEIVRIKTVYRFLHEKKHIRREYEWPSDFCKPSERVLRKHRRESGKKLFTAADIHEIVIESGVHAVAMWMIGLNCGYGPTDLALLARSDIDWDQGVIELPRSKTEVERTSPLWPETQDALQKSLLKRTESKLPNVFLTQGKPWNKSDDSQLSKYFTAIRRRTSVVKGGLYWLRHTFATVAGGSTDQVAVNALMGHVDGTMAGVYREEIDIDRLRAVTEHVRDWYLRG